MWWPFFDFSCETPPQSSRAIKSVLEDNVLTLGEESLTSASPTHVTSIDGSSKKGVSAAETSPRLGPITPVRKPPLKVGKINVGIRGDNLQVQGLRIQGGTGRCLASIAILQDRAFWEVHVIEVNIGPSARLFVGTCTNPRSPSVLQEELGTTPNSYGVHFGVLGHAPFCVGDVIGVAYDQAVFPVTLNVWVNGKPVVAPFPRGLKGEQWPAIFLSDGVVDWALDESHWKYAACQPSGFSALIPSRGLIGD